MKKQIIPVIVSLFITCSFTGTTSMAASNSYQDTMYTYTYKKGDYQDTAGRYKKYSGSDTPHGYAYAICGNGNPSSVKLMALSSTSTQLFKCCDYVTIPYLVHTNIRNTFNANKYKYAVLRVRDNTNKGSTGGSWSPDSSKKYNHIVG